MADMKSPITNRVSLKKRLVMPPTATARTAAL